MIVEGLVQGVAFRWSARRSAEELGIEGWVRNLADRRRVEAWVQGEEAAVSAMLDFLRGGPPGAQVLRCEATERALLPLQGFSVRPTAARPEA